MSENGQRPDERPADASSAEDRPPFGRRLELAMAKAKLSQNALQHLAHLGRGYVSRLVTGDRGQNIEAKTLFEIARILSVRAEWLWYGTGPMEDESAPKWWNDEAPSREIGATIARLVDLPEASIDRVLLRYSGPEHDSNTALWWLDQIRTDAFEAARVVPLADLTNPRDKRAVRARIQRKQMHKQGVAAHEKKKAEDAARAATHEAAARRDSHPPKKGAG